MWKCKCCGAKLNDNDKECPICHLGQDGIKKGVNDFVVECPYCKSSNTVKISALTKAEYFAVLGILSMGKNSKQWHCNRCGSDF